MSNRVRQPIFRIAASAFKAHVWINVKLCAVFVCLSLLACLFTAFTMSVDNHCDDIFAQNTSSNYMYGPSDQTELLNASGLVNFRHYSVQRYNLGNRLKEEINADIPTVTTNYITLKIGAISYYFDRDQTPEMLWLYKGDPFSEIDLGEMRSRFGSDSLYSGRFPQNGTNEVLISERLIEQYHLAPGDVLDTSVAILLGDRDLNFTLKVVGIIYKEYYLLSGHREAWQITPSVVAAETNSIPAVNVGVDTFHVYAFDEWTTLSVDELNRVSSEGGLTYCGIGSYQQRIFLENIRTVVINVYCVVGAVLAGGLLLTVMLMTDKFVAIFSRLGGILLSGGLEQGNLTKLLLTQLLLVFLLSTPFAIAGSLVGYAVIVDLVELGTGMSMSVSTATLATLSALSAAVVFAAVLIFFGIASLRLRRRSVKQLLTAEAG